MSPKSSQLASMSGIVLVRAPKMRSTPQPPVHVLRNAPSAPACSRESGRSRTVTPAARRLLANVESAAARAVFMSEYSAGVAFTAHVVSGRQVGCPTETSTNLPFTVARKFWRSPGARKVGIVITSPSTSLPPVPGLHASMIASSERTRGEMRSTCVGPRIQLRHVP